MTHVALPPGDRSATRDVAWYIVGAALFAAGLAVAAITSLPLTWDGAWFFVHAMDSGEPAFLYRRAIHAALQAPAILIRAVADDATIPALAFSAAYAAVPLIGLLAAWRVIRPDRSDLVIWPFLGIALVALPGQVFFVAEGGIALAFGWPLLLAAALGRLGLHRWLALALSIAIAVSHPFGGPVLAGVGIVAWLARWRGSGTDPIWVGPMLVVTGAVLFAIHLALRSSYEADATTVDRFVLHVRGGVVGPIVIAPLTAWFIGAAALLPMRGRARAAIIIGLLALATAVLVPWAADPTEWSTALRYRTWLPFLVVPLAPMAVIDAFRGPADRPDRPIAWIGAPAVAALVLVAQSASWMGLVDRLSAAVASADTTCVVAEDLAWLGPTPLAHWSVTSLGLVAEGRGSEHLVVFDRPCAGAVQDDRVTIKLTPYDRDDRPIGGWWRFEAIVDAWPPE